MRQSSVFIGKSLFNCRIIESIFNAIYMTLQSFDHTLINLNKIAAMHELLERSRSLQWIIKRNLAWALRNVVSTIFRLSEISFETKRNIVVANSRQNEVSARSRWDIVELSFSREGNLSDISRRYQRNIARTKRDIRRISFALLLHNTVYYRLTITDLYSHALVSWEK